MTREQYIENIKERLNGLTKDELKDVSILTSAQLGVRQKLAEKERIENEITNSKSRLDSQQPEIPEVSKEVANIYEKHKDQHHKLSVILEELYVNTFATFGSSLTQGEVDDIVVAMRTNGYTVAKEKRFYLKHIEMSKRDVHHDYYAQIRNERFEHDSVESGMLPQHVITGVTFTQSEIDSMETGSYEQIEVEE